MKRAILLALMLGLSACGFHLRGMVDRPQWLDNVAIITQDGNKELFPVLISQLQAYSIKISSDPASAKYWLILMHTHHQQQINGIGASTNPRQYQLIYNVEFMLRTPQGKIIKPPGHITVTRQLTVNNNSILGSDEEATLLLNEMRRDVVIQLINRLGR